MSQLHHTIIRPIFTEKSTAQGESLNKVAFKISSKATKHQVRQAVEQLFGVKVDKVNTQVIPGKPKRAGRQTYRRGGYKKAVVTLAEGNTIDFFALEGDFDGSEDEFGPEDFAEENAASSEG